MGTIIVLPIHFILTFIFQLKKQYSSLFKKILVPQEVCFIVKVLKMSKISRDFYVKHADILNRLPF